MKTSMLMKIVAALAIGAAFPIRAIAEPAMLRERHDQPAKTTIERGGIETVNALQAKGPNIKTPRKHYFAHNWLDS
jgi:hypothetical protein